MQKLIAYYSLFYNRTINNNYTSYYHKYNANTLLLTVNFDSLHAINVL